MAAPVLQFKRGAFSNLPALKAGEPGFTTDKYDLYVGLDSNSANNKFFGSHRYWTRETTTAGSGINLVEGSDNGSNAITVKSPGNLSSNITLILPDIQGFANSVLTNDGSGNLTWSSGSADPTFTGIATFNTSQVNINSTLLVAGVTTFTDTTDNTLGNADTGAVQIDGGVGINKNVSIGQSLSVSGQIKPSAGNASNNGIEWASDIGGGSGDRAFIKYYAQAGEDTRLHIAALNDGDDDIYLEATTVSTSSDLTVNGIFTANSSALFSDTTDNTLGDANTGAVQIDGGVGIDKNLSVGAAASIASNLYVGGQSEFVGVVTFRGGTISIGDANTDDVVIGGEFASNLIPTTSLLYDLGSSAKRWADVYARSADFNGDINVTGLSTFNGLEVVNNGISVAGFSTIYDLHILQDLYVNGIFEVDAAFASHGNSVLAGIVSFTGTKQSTNYQDGAVVLDGGIGIGKNANIHGNLTVDGNVTIGGTFVALKGQDVFIENKDFILGYTTSITPNDDTANHAGVAIASTIGSPLTSFAASGINTLPDTYKQLMWFKDGTLGFSTDAFAFNYALAVGTTTMASGVVLAVGSGVTASNDSVSATNLYGNGLLNNLNVSGLSTFVGVSTFKDNVFIDGALTVAGVNISGGASIGADVTTRNLNVTGLSTFSGATVFLSSITGTASTATRATTVDTTATSTNADYFVPFVDTIEGQESETVRVGVGLSLNPSTGEVKTAGALSVGSPTALTSYIKAGGGSNAMYLYSNGDVSFQSKVIADNIRSSSNSNNTITLSDLDATFARNVSVAGIATVTGQFVTGTNATIGGDITIGGNDIKASDGTTAITLTASTGAVGVSSDLTVSGSLFVRGTTTEVNTETLKVEDSLIEVGLVNSGGSLVPPSSDLNIDVGVLFHYYTSSAKKAGVYWDDSVSRVVISSDLSESSSVITSTTYAPLEIGSLWVTDCAGTSQVISCSGSERFLENITVDGGAF